MFLQLSMSLREHPRHISFRRDLLLQILNSKSSTRHIKTPKTEDPSKVTLFTISTPTKFYENGKETKNLPFSHRIRVPLHFTKDRNKIYNSYQSTTSCRADVRFFRGETRHLPISLSILTLSECLRIWWDRKTTGWVSITPGWGIEYLSMYFIRWCLHLGIPTHRNGFRRTSLRSSHPMRILTTTTWMQDFLRRGFQSSIRHVRHFTMVHRWQGRKTSSTTNTTPN